MTHGHVKPKDCNHTFHRLGGIDDCPECNPDNKKQAPRRWILENHGGELFSQPLIDTYEEVIEASAYDAIVKERDELMATLKHDVDKIEAQYVAELQLERRKVEKLREQRNGWIEKWALIECGEYPFTPLTARRYSKDDDAELEAIDKGEG
jgi:hypothetical protein